MSNYRHYIYTYRHGWVSETLYMRIATQNSVFTAPMNTCHTSFRYILWAYTQQIKQQHIWSVHTASIGKENRESRSAVWRNGIVRPCCFTSTEARLLIRDGDRGGKGMREWRLNRGYCPEKTGETMDCRQNNGSVKAVSPRHCPATSALRNCCFNCHAGQSHKDNVRCTAVEERPEAKEVQLLQPSSTFLFMISSGLSWGSSFTSLLLILPGCVYWKTAELLFKSPPTTLFTKVHSGFSPCHWTTGSFVGVCGLGFFFGGGGWAYILCIPYNRAPVFSVTRHQIRPSSLRAGFKCLRDPQNSDMDYRVLDTCVWSFCVRIYTGKVGWAG